VACKTIDAQIPKPKVPNHKKIGLANDELLFATKGHKDRKEILFFVLYVFFRGYFRFPASWFPNLNDCLLFPRFFVVWTLGV
jgi:hypothetical protein